MKRLVPIVMVLSLGLWFGCSSDDDDGDGNGNGGVTMVTVIADTTAAPSLDSVNDPAWDGVAEKTLEVSGENLPKIGSVQSSAITAVNLKAILKADTLYLKLSWADPTYSVWRDVFSVDLLIPAGQDTIAEFTPVINAEEDQVFVMFDMPDKTDWDVWNWRALTTAPGGLAEGFTLRRDGLSWNDSAIISIDTTVTPWDTNWQFDAGTIDTLLPDVGNLAVAYRNKSVGFSQPKLMHTDSSAFSGHILLLDATVALRATAGWRLGDSIPGWYIDGSFHRDNPTHVPDDFNSRFDIKAISSYDTGIYTVVLARALNSYPDDLDLSALGQVKVKIGLLDNQTRLMTGSGRRGFTSEFWLVLP